MVGHFLAGLWGGAAPRFLLPTAGARMSTVCTAHPYRPQCGPLTLGVASRSRQVPLWPEWSSGPVLGLFPS